MSALRRTVAVVLLGACAVGAVGASGALAPATADETPARKPTPLDVAIERGVAYLLEHQKKNGCWGSPASNLYDIFAPIPGSQRSFEVASTALALSALLEVGGDDPKVKAAIAKARAYLLARPVVKRIRPNTLYNTWSLIYGLEAFARLLQREKDPDGRKELLAAAQACVAGLDRFEFVEGGWGYYNFGLKSKDPGPGSTSFTTASGLIALAMAAEQGVKVPKRLVKRGVDVVNRCGRPDGAYAYSMRTRFSGTSLINKTKGSLARTPACIMALRMSGEEVDPARFVQALEELETYGHFLRIARKYPRPHETWYANSGYFCFYGYYYASMTLGEVPKAKRAVFARQIAGHLIPLQEKDGSWWDYQLFGYHKAYGTGYVLMVLGACRE